VFEVFKDEWPRQVLESHRFHIEDGLLKNTRISSRFFNFGGIGRGSHLSMLSKYTEIK